MRIDILSLFPKYFEGPFDESIIKRAQEKGLLDIRLTDIRDFAEGIHRSVDDRAYGGGPGMVMMPGPTSKAIRSVATEKSRVIYLSPQGKPLTAEKCRELAKCEHIVMLCGHYEGIDERIIDEEIDEEISIGDYVLTNGCLPAIVLVDAVARFVPGVLGHDEAADADSFEEGIFDHPHYTRPSEWEGKSVPEVLRGGDHKKIEQWRYDRALKKTKKTRPDLYTQHLINVGDENDDQTLKRASRRWRRSSRVEQGLKKTTLLVSDLKKSIHFYIEELGLELVRHGKNNAVFDLGNLHLCLVQGIVPDEGTNTLEECPVVFEMQAYDQEAFQELAKKGKQQNSSDLLIEIVDPDGYLWCVRYDEKNH